ncbi:putative MFS multidrug transporter [Trichoderma camerunense]
METLQPWARSVLIAEFSFSTSIPAAFPHVLAAQYNSTVEALLGDREEWNIRSPLTPSQMTQAGERAGFRLDSHKTMTPGEKNREGSLEVRMLLKAKEFEDERQLVEQRHGPRIALMLNGLKDAVAESVERLGGGGIEAVRNMNVWLAKFDVISKPVQPTAGIPNSDPPSAPQVGGQMPSVTSAMENREASESTRLLRPQDGHDSAPQPSLSIVPSARHTILVVAAIQIVLNIGSYVSFAAQLAILQDIVCKSHYEEGQSLSMDDDRCKVDAVQSEVAFINGWKDVFEMLPAIILAVPYGALADRIGRKSVFLLAIVGIGMNDLWMRMVFWFSNFFPIRAVWFGGLWQIIGAGAASLSSISHVMVADLQSAIMIAQFIFVPVGGTLVSINPWIPMMISSVVTVLGFFGALIFLPETLQSTERDFSSTSVTDNDHGDQTSPTGTKHGFQIRWTNLVAGCAAMMKWVKQNSRLVVVLVCFFPWSIGQQASGTLLLQYASKRLNWSLGKASYLVSLGAGINLIVHAVGIPALSTVLLWRLKLHEIAKDKRIAQISGVFLVLGTSIIFAAGSWTILVLGQVVYSMGLAFSVPARSIVTSMVEKRHLAALYTTISVLLYGGMLTGGPLFAGAFGWGLRLGGLWIGMPYLISCGCFALALLAVSTAPAAGKMPRAVDNEDGDGVDSSGP